MSTRNVLYLSQAFVEFFLVETDYIFPDAKDESQATRTKHPLLFLVAATDLSKNKTAPVTRELKS